MDLFFRGLHDDCADTSTGIVRCPFLRNINEPTNFSFSSTTPLSMPVRGAKGPIFEDGPNFDMAFRLFHGRDGVVPLSETSFTRVEKVESEPAPLQFNPLAAKAATISLSFFAPGVPFSFEGFSRKWNTQNGNPKKNETFSKGGKPKHEALSNEWLQTGSCPIAKSYRAAGNVLPLVANALHPPPAIVAALSKTAFAKNPRPQPALLSQRIPCPKLLSQRIPVQNCFRKESPSKVLAIGLLGMAANVPLGIWQEHTDKFSPSWFAAVHATVPFIEMLRKSVLIPKTAITFTIAASILGQVIGSKAERCRLKTVAAKSSAPVGASLSAANELQVIAVYHCGKYLECEPASLHLALPLSSTDVFA